MLWAAGVCSVCCVVFLAVRTSALISVPVGWERSFNLTPAGYDVRDFSLCTSGLFVGGVVEADSAEGRGIFSAVSVDGGVNFSPFTKVILLPSSKTEVRAKSNPFASVSGDGVFSVVWQEYDEDASIYSISLCSSRDYGATWNPPVRLNFGTGMDFMPRIYYDDRRRLHLYYLAPDKTGFNLYHVMSEDAATFGSPQRVAKLASSMKGAFFPSIIYDGEDVYAAWQARGLENDKLTDDIYFSTSSNYGSSWSSPRRISTGTAFNAAPCLLKNKGRLVCVYENNERKNWEIRFLMSLDKGDTWDQSAMTVSMTNANCYAPSAVLTDSDEVAFFWYDNREGVNRVFTRRYGLNDNRFSKELALSEGAAGARFPVCYLSSRRIVALWDQGGRIRGKFSDSSAAAPKLYSSTHPEGVWTKNTEAIIEWQTPFDESGVAGYASILSKDPDTNPTVQNLNANTRMERIRSIGDGVTWYHIRTIDGAGNYSRTLHYPLRVSRTPLFMPIVESSTHPEGKSVQSNAPVLSWQITDLDRVKGFYYSLTRDYPARPSVFTESLSASFQGLEEGRYFFRIQAVDMTNTPGRATDYEIIVGKAEAYDPSKKKINDKDDILKGTEDKTEKRPAYVWQPPYCVIEYPAAKASFSQNSLVSLVKGKAGRNVHFDSFEYELSKDGAKISKGSSGSGRIVLNELADGTYTLSVRGRYSLMVNGRLTKGSTRQESVAFTVSVPPVETPIAAFTRTLSDKTQRYIFPLSLLLFAGGTSLVFRGNIRLLYLLRATVYRLSTRLRLVLSFIR
jgi:hypothetical protein